MTLKAIIHDFQPQSLCDGVETHSTLMLPFGVRYLVNALLDALSAVGCKEVMVVPAFEPNVAYTELLTSAAGRDLTVVPPDERGALLLDGESSDSLLFVDPRFYPEGGYDFAALMDGHHACFGAVFVTDGRRDCDGKDERVVLDNSGNVRKVQRVYDRMAWSQGDAMVVPFCVVPHVVALHGPRFPLSAMRSGLATRGVPIRDLPATSAVVYLNRREDVLRVVSERVTTASRAEVAGLTRHAEHAGVWIDPSATVASSVRFVGDVIVNGEALIAEDATIIGPTLIGYGAEVGQQATVAQSLVMDRAMVSPAGVIHHGIVVGRYRGGARGAGTALRRPSSVAPDESFSIVENGKASDPTALRRRMTLVIKRAIDLVVSGTGLVLLSPLLVVVAILVKLTSRGPVLFSHRREGRGGREFGCIKFRTMRKDVHDLQRALAAENEADGPQFVIKHDPRVTGLGRILRKTNIDELPQLINVLLGQMSLVGPRPSPFRENQVCAPWRRARLSVPPGITGLWQICRYDREEGDFHQWIYFDTAYVRHLSVRLDLKILWYTLWTLGGLRSVSLEKVLGPAAGGGACANAVPQC